MANSGGKTGIVRVVCPLTNHQIRLASRPVGLPTRANWQSTTEAVAKPVEGGVLLKTLALSLDPAMRGWMNEGKSYIPPVAVVVGVGEVMRAGGVGKVVASRNPKFAVGDYVSAGFGVPEYLTLAQADFKSSGLVKIDLSMGMLTQWLNVLVNRARMEDIVVFDYADRYHLAVAEMAGYLKDGA